MILFVNERDEIKDVNQTADTSLIPLEVNDDTNPFKGWSVAKICCYKVNVKDGIVTMMTPYVDSRLIEHIEQLGKSIEVNASDISDNRDGLIETFEGTAINSEDISALREGLEEVYEMLIESEV